MSRAMFCGVGCAMVTPFAGGRVDFEALEKLVERQLTAGTDALIVLGTTGEPCTLTEGEMCEIVRRTCAQVNRRVPVIAGAGANATFTAARRARLMRDAGADAILSVTPYYNKANQEGLIEHFTAVADAAEIPVILYNVPSRTGVNLLPETVETLLKHPGIQGVKEANADIGQLTRLLRTCGEGCHVYSGNDDELLPALALGAHGVISVAANIIPKEMRAITQSAQNGDFVAARREFLRVYPLLRALFIDISPIPVKAAMEMLGWIREELRLPLTALSDENRKVLRCAMENVGLL